MNRNLLSASAVALAALLIAVWIGAAGGREGIRGEIRAVCIDDKPVILSKTGETDHLSVVCVGGLPEVLVSVPPVPVHDPVKNSLPPVVPPDFGGWITVWLNDRPLQTPYDPVRGVQEPGAYLAASTGRVMIPVRFFTEAFGGEVRWNPETREVRLYMTTLEKVLQMTIGEPEAKVNLAPVRLDQPPLIVADRTFVPIRFLAEGLGATVTWDGSRRSVLVELNGFRCLHPVYCGEAR